MTAIKKDIAAELRILEKDNGVLRPEDVVESARDPESILHSHFTWDDTDAARKQRIHEARALIRTVRIDVTVRDIPLTVCGYVRDPESDPREAGYRSVAVVRNDEDLARAALVDEMKRVGNAVVRAKKLAWVFGAEDVVEQIEALAQTITDMATIRQQPEAQ